MAGLQRTGQRPARPGHLDRRHEHPNLPVYPAAHHWRIKRVEAVAQPVNAKDSHTGLCAVFVFSPKSMLEF